MSVQPTQHNHSLWFLKYWQQSTTVSILLARDSAASEPLARNRICRVLPFCLFLSLALWALVPVHALHNSVDTSTLTPTALQVLSFFSLRKNTQPWIVACCAMLCYALLAPAFAVGWTENNYLKVVVVVEEGRRFRTFKAEA